MNVAVITDVPALPKSSCEPEMVVTDVDADEYDHVPVIERPLALADGDVMLAFVSPYVADTLLQVNVGVALLIVIVNGSLVAAL